MCFYRRRVVDGAEWRLACVEHVAEHPQPGELKVPAEAPRPIEDDGLLADAARTAAADAVLRSPLADSSLGHVDAPADPGETGSIRRAPVAGGMNHAARADVRRPSRCWHRRDQQHQSNRERRAHRRSERSKSRVASRHLNLPRHHRARLVGPQHGRCQMRASAGGMYPGPQRGARPSSTQRPRRLRRST